MRRSASVSLLVASLAAIALASFWVGGCSSSSDDDGPTGGSVTGRTFDAASGLGIGGVTVAIETNSGEVSATSVAPSGTFSISGIPAGNYARLHITPDPGLYGVGSDFYVDIAITVSQGSSYDLPGNILIVDEAPPDPA